MASTLAGFGFRPAYHNSGQMRAKAYTIATGYAANIFTGDPVKLIDATGVIQLATSTGARNGTIAGQAITGIFVGCEYIDALGKPTVSPYWPTGTTATEIVAYVIDDPEVIFECVIDNQGTPGTDSVQLAVGDQFDWYQAASPYGSTATGISTAYLYSKEGSGAGQFQVVGLGRHVTDVNTDAYVVVQVRINEHQYKGSVNVLAT